MIEEQYFINNNKRQCVTIPERECDYLKHSEFLGEFKTDQEQKEARDNLGITDLLKQLEDKISQKVIEVGGAPSDIEPTEGHENYWVTSDGLYRYLLNNYLSQEAYNVDRTTIFTRIEDLERQLTSCCNSGVALSGNLGDSEDIGINQKKLTEIIQNLYNLIEQYTGNYSAGLIMTVDPDYFFGDECTVNITATTQRGTFDTISFYKDGDTNPIGTNSGVNEYTITTTINNTTEIRCIASILGQRFEDSKMIYKIYPFYLGSSHEGYQDVIRNVEPLKIIGNKITGNYELEVRENGDHLYLIFPKQFKDQAIKWDMNGFEIPHTVEEPSNAPYIVYKSTNTYNKRTYSKENCNIDMTNKGIDITDNEGYNLNTTVIKDGNQ